ncbi:MAG: hypothetical protein V3U98_07105 [Acidobacteriota bacterium]
MRRPREALEHYRRAALSGGNDALTERGQGLAMERTDEAKPHLQRSLVLDPGQRGLMQLLQDLEPSGPE